MLAALKFEINVGDADPWAASSRPALLAFGAFLGAFLFIRTSARLMRSPKVPWWPGSVTSGDLHIHHLVWGIVLMMLAGFVSLTPIDSPWHEIMAVLFGIGAGMTFMPLTTIMMAEIPASDAGVASGVGNVTMQVGGALGLAALGTITSDHTRTLVGQGQSLVSALTAGYQLGYSIAAACVAVGLLIVIFVLRTPSQARPVLAYRRTARATAEEAEAA